VDCGFGWRAWPDSTLRPAAEKVVSGAASGSTARTHAAPFCETGPHGTSGPQKRKGW